MKIEKSERIYMLAQLSSRSNQEQIKLLKDWLSFVRILTEPKFYRIDNGPTLPFDLLTIKDRIDGMQENENLWMKIRSSEGEFQVHVSGLSIIERNIFNKNVFYTYKGMIENYFDLRLAEYGVYGYIRALDDYLYNNVERLNKRDFNTEEELERLPKRYNNNREIVIDCNQLSGYDVFYKGLCLTSCWKMYYSSLYFQLIPKQVILEVQQVQAIEELENEMVKISLYLDPFKWDEEVNRTFQYLFRDQIGFDQLTWNNGIGVLRPPVIEYAFIDQIVQTVQYQNNQLQPVEKRKATHFVTRSSDFIRQQYTEHRSRGVLNVQAYFPWIDHRGKKMMNYRVLDPELSLDEGIAAYEFHIRQHLEIPINDERYEQYLAVLRFYLPDRVLEHLPLEKLEQRLADTTVSNLNKRDEATYFDLKKAENHLRVAFLSISHLKSEELEIKSSNE